MRFIPMNLSQWYLTISQADLGNTFNFSPSVSPVQLLKSCSVTNTFASSNRFHVREFADELKIHCEDFT